MARLTTKARGKLPATVFGLPGERAYPMPDKAHAANAKARANGTGAKNLTPAQKRRIIKKANTVLGE